MPPIAMKRFDRMGHPVSHTAAVTAGVSVLFLICIVWLGSGIPRARYSPVWWGAGVGVACVLASSLVSYFKPHSLWALVPLGVSGAVMLGLCAWSAWGVIVRDDLSRAHQPAIFTAMWVGWAAAKFGHWRKARAGAAAGAASPSTNHRTLTPR